MKRIRLGVIGCGDAAWQIYFPGLAAMKDTSEVAGVCAQRRESAERAAELFPGARSYTSYSDMLAREDLDAALNLTPIPLHDEVNLACLESGRHLYTEKPLASSTLRARAMVEAAESRGLKLACAPAMVLTPDYRMLAHIVAGGHIGRVCWVRAQASHQGPARFWHFRSDPSPYYQTGSGPLFDLAIYPLHGLTGALGPVRRVGAMTATRIPELRIVSGPRRGETMRVETYDTALLTLEFASGVIGQLDGTFCVHAEDDDPKLEVYGEKGAVHMSSWYPWGGLKVFRRDSEARLEGWQYPGKAFPGLFDAEYARWSKLNMAAGLEAFAESIRDDVPPLAGGRHALHVIEVIEKAAVAASTGVTQSVESTFPSPVGRMTRGL